MTNSKKFLEWLRNQTYTFEFGEWLEHSNEMVEALYAKFIKWDRKDFKNAPVWPDVYDELSNSPRS